MSGAGPPWTPTNLLRPHEVQGAVPAQPALGLLTGDKGICGDTGTGDMGTGAPPAALQDRGPPGWPLRPFLRWRRHLVTCSWVALLPQPRVAYVHVPVLVPLLVPVTVPTSPSGGKQGAGGKKARAGCRSGLPPVGEALQKCQSAEQCWFITFFQKSLNSSPTWVSSPLRIPTASVTGQVQKKTRCSTDAQSKRLSPIPPPTLLRATSHGHQISPVLSLGGPKPSHPTLLLHHIQDHHYIFSSSVTLSFCLHF